MKHTANPCTFRTHSIGHARCRKGRHGSCVRCAARGHLFQFKAARDKAKADARAEYKNTPKARAQATEDTAEARYRAAKKRCDTLAGNAKDVCIERARADRERAEATATERRSVAEARAKSADEQRDAEYRVAREKCDSFSGEAKDRCVADARARFGK